VNNAIAIPEELTQAGSFWEKPISNWSMIDLDLPQTLTHAFYFRYLLPIWFESFCQ
jgi:hypothetical protein